MPCQSYKLTGAVIDHDHPAIHAALWLLVVLFLAPTAKSQERPVHAAVVVSDTNSQAPAGTSADAPDPSSSATVG
jgi:hypothetical protein